MGEHWKQSFTFEEVAQALVHFAIMRGAPPPVGYDTTEPVLHKPTSGSDAYIRLSFRPAPLHTEGKG